MDAFFEASTFIYTIFLIFSNFFAQKTLRSFFIVNIQMENKYKEQTELFENLIDGAVIYK